MGVFWAIIGVMGGLGLLLGLGLVWAHRRLPPDGSTIADAVEALLPQTQCAQCGYPGCRPYAEAVADGAAIDLCPPGGAETVEALGRLLGRQPEPPQNRHPAAPQNPPAPASQAAIAVIDETRCIGCYLCVRACPVDAIVGAPQLMHTVLADQCTGCELCIEPCPVDCISLRPVADPVDIRPIRIMARPRNRQPEHPELSCIRCGACQTLCPEALFPQELLWYARNEAWEAAADRGLDACIECGLCNQACPSNIDLLTHFSRGRQVLAHQAQARTRAEHARERYGKHQERTLARQAERDNRRRERLSAGGQRPWQR